MGTQQQIQQAQNSQGHFENLLDWKTGHALPDRPGVGEWLDAINSQACKYRIVLTSRPFPRGTREFRLTR